MTKGYSEFVALLEATIATYPSLERILVDGNEILKGQIPIVDRDGKHWDEYEIEIHSSANFPYEFPALFETSGKIPRIGDWHIYEDTGSCCVKVRPEEILRCRNGITLIDYIREEVIPYLFNQTHRRVEGYYVNGEYSHGIKGIFEFYANTLQTGNDIKKTIGLMRFIALNVRPGRTSLCFCGKKIKFRHCHRDAFDLLKSLGKEMLENDSYLIAKAAGLI